MSALSKISSVSGSQMLLSVMRFGSGVNEGSPTRVRIIFRERGPLRRMTPIPLRPGGVDKATMVSVVGTAGRVDKRDSRASVRSEKTKAFQGGHKLLTVFLE